MNADEDVGSRIRKANGAFIQLSRLWKNRNVSRATKIRIFNTNVKSVLLYGCETWKITGRIVGQLQTFINRCLRRITCIYWPEVISNENLWQLTNQCPVQEELKRRKWRWIGHTLRKEDGAIEKAALSWNPQGSRRQGRPRMTWRRTVEAECRQQRKTWAEVKRLAANRDEWRTFSDALCFSRSERN